MVCIYTAQGEFVCKEIEKFEEDDGSFGVVENPYASPQSQTIEQYVNCYDVKGESCNTCYDVKNVYDKAGKKFNPKTIEQCRNPDPKGSWKKNCRWGTVSQNGIYSPQCKINNKWPANRNNNKSQVDLFSCVSGKLYYNPSQSVVTCEK